MNKIITKKRLKLIVFLTLCLCPRTYSQDIKAGNASPSVKGVPGIVHYNRNDFKADPQFWAVCEDKDGVLYFGNNDGAIIFDGERWHKINLPNNSSIRCLTSDSSGNVYAGGFNEFGLIKKDNSGRYYYQSLFDTLKFDDPKIENLWQVDIINSTVIYRSFRKLIAITGKKVTKLPARNLFIKSFLVGDQYYVQDLHEGIFLLDLENMKFIKCFSPSQLDEEIIISFLPTDSPSKVMAVSKSGKLFNLNLESHTVKTSKRIFDPADGNQVECAIEGCDNYYYLGTLSSGIIRLNKSGDVYHDEENFKDLQDNSVLGLYETRQGNIWALLNNGLDCITFNSPVTTIFENASLYDVLILKNDMYLATNQGIFYADSIHLKKPNFTKINGLEGQGWTLQQCEGDILVGHDKGLYKINKTKTRKIGDFSGIWKVIPIKEKKGMYLAASYGGIYVIRKNASGKWVSLRRIEGFDESTRDILETETPGTYWVCHGYKGVYRIKLDESYSRVVFFEHFTTQNGFTFPYSINVFKWQNQIVFTTDQGIFSYHQNENQFTPYLSLNKVLDSTKNTRMLKEFKEKTWFIQDDEVGYFNTNDAILQKDYFLQFKGSFNRGMECIIPINSDQVLLGTKTGLYLFDLTYKNRIKKAQTIITAVRSITNQDEKWLPLDSKKPIILPNKTNSIRFDFAVPQMQNDADIQYSYKLENIDKTWSIWQSASYKEYSHLRPGKYVFKVKSRSLVGTPGAITSMEFELLPLWYQTVWAVIAYFLAVVAIIIILIKLVKRKIAYENQKTRDEEQKAKKLLELELAQLRLRAEKDKINKDKVLLQEDIIHKSKELANYTMLLVKKKEIFEEIKEDIKEVRNYVRNESSRKKLQKMFSKLSRHVIGEEYMIVFETNFEKVHHLFFTNLKELYPDLTQKELRLCAFVKMNLTNKEIAPLLNISVRGVETARYRIRKKLNLEHEHNFVEFLENLVTENV